MAARSEFHCGQMPTPAAPLLRPPPASPRERDFSQRRHRRGRSPEFSALRCRPSPAGSSERWDPRAGRCPLRPRSGTGCSRPGSCSPRSSGSTCCSRASQTSVHSSACSAGRAFPAVNHGAHAATARPLSGGQRHDRRMPEPTAGREDACSPVPSWGIAGQRTATTPDSIHAALFPD